VHSFSSPFSDSDLLLALGAPGHTVVRGSVAERFGGQRRPLLSILLGCRSLQACAALTVAALLALLHQNFPARPALTWHPKRIGDVHA